MLHKSGNKELEHNSSVSSERFSTSLVLVVGRGVTSATVARRHGVLPAVLGCVEARGKDWADAGWQNRGRCGVHLAETSLARRTARPAAYGRRLRGRGERDGLSGSLVNISKF